MFDLMLVSNMCPDAVKSLVEDEFIELAKTLMHKAEQKGGLGGYSCHVLGCC